MPRDDAVYLFPCAAPGKSSLLQGRNPGTGLSAAGAAAGFVVATPQGVRGGAGDVAGPGDGAGDVEGVRALGAAVAASVASDAVRKLLPERRWSNASQPGDRLHAAEAAEARGEDAPPDDVAFLWDVAACVRDTLHVPLTGAVFAAGWSQGGKLASGLACANETSASSSSSAPAPAPAPAGAAAGLPGRAGFTLAAVAVGAGLSSAQCAASAGIPLLMLQGGDDDLVPFCKAGAPYRAGVQALDAWAATRGCPPLSAGSGWSARCGADVKGLKLFTPPRCAPPPGRASAPLGLYWLPKLPHDVPSGKLPGLNGTFADLVVSFFKSAVAGDAEVAPLRSSAPQTPPMADCGGGTPCE
jgi:poly(3-hydroxybutyrate) depolymerase